MPLVDAEPARLYLNRAKMNRKQFQSRREREEVEFISMRMRMVDEQLARRDVRDARVLAAMRTVPRHRFVSMKRRPDAYKDGPLPIGYDQTISQPYVVASMTEHLELEPDSRVLEIGTGCGYQTAVLAEITPHVFSIERIPGLLKKANQVLHKLGYKNIKTLLGDGSLGWEQHAPYDAIIVTCAPDHVPPSLLQQIKDDGGRIVIPVGGIWMVQTLMKIEKIERKIKSKGIIGVRFVPMIGHSR